MEGLEELAGHIPVEVVELHVPNEQGGDVSIESFSIRHFYGSCCDAFKTINNRLLMHLVYR